MHDIKTEYRMLIKLILSKEKNVKVQHFIINKTDSREISEWWSISKDSG